MNKSIFLIFVSSVFCVDSCAMQGKPQSWGQKTINYFSRFFSKPATVPADFDLLPPDVKRIIINHAITSETTLENAVLTAQSLSALKRFNTIINDVGFTDKLIEQLHTKYKSGWGRFTKLDIALALGTSGARTWIADHLKRDNLITHPAEEFVINVLKNYWQVNPIKENQAIFLLRSGVNPNLTSGDDSLIVLAVKAQKKPMVETLLALGADPNQNAIPRVECPTDLLYEEFPETALDYALASGNKEIINLLKRAGAKTREQIAKSLCRIS